MLLSGLIGNMHTHWIHESLPNLETEYQKNVTLSVIRPVLDDAFLKSEAFAGANVAQVLIW